MPSTCIDELRDVVEGKPWLQIAKIAAATLKDCCWASVGSLAPGAAFH